MKRYLFILAVIALLAFTACSSQETQPTSTLPAAQPAASPDDIDTSELDQLEQDLTSIEQGY